MKSQIWYLRPTKNWPKVSTIKLDTRNRENQNFQMQNHKFQRLELKTYRSLVRGPTTLRIVRQSGSRAELRRCVPPHLWIFDKTMPQDNGMRNHAKGRTKCMLQWNHTMDENSTWCIEWKLCHDIKVYCSEFCVASSFLAFLSSLTAWFSTGSACLP